MSSSWYRRGTVTVTDGSKEVVGVGTLWVDAGNKPLAGDIMFIAGSIYEVESITDNEHLSLFRPFTGVPPANGEYAIIRNTSVTIATRVAAMVAAAINSKQVLLDDLRGYYTSTADKVLIHTDDGSTIEVVPLQTLVSDITNLIAQSESIKNDLANTQAALDLVRQYSNAAQGVEVEPGKYSAKSYAADAADTLALVNKAKSDVDLKASQVQQTKTDIEQFVSTSKTEIDAKATAISTAIATQATTVKGEITTLVTTSKSQISAQVTTGKSDIAELITGGTDSISSLSSTSQSEITALATKSKSDIVALATQSKKDITTLTTTSKGEISDLVAGGTNSITSLTDTSKGAINTLVSASKTEITDLATTEKAAISQQSTAAISEMTSLKQSAEQAASTATQKATQAAASATSAAQSKTDAQTLKTQTEALANETKQVAEEIKSGSYVGWQIYCQSEANMKAQRALASNEFAASGFVHYGKHVQSSTWDAINEGMFVNTANNSVLARGKIIMGELTSAKTGSSKTDFPVTHIAGFISKVLGYTAQSGLNSTQIKFPEAPNGTVVYDSTGNCRGSGKATLDLTKDVDPKYGNVAADVNEAVGRAFEGQIKNGDFRDNTVSWGVSNSATMVMENGALRLTTNGSVNGQLFPQGFGPRAGVNKIRIVISDLKGGAAPVWQYKLGSSAYVSQRLYEGVNEFTADFTGLTSFIIQPKGNATGSSILVHEVSVSLATEEVVINRVDLFGFEYFLEEISKANPFVYPYGCIQSKLTSIEGIATKESNRPITYYSVFDGDTTSKGKGVDFWAATDAQKRALVSNPDHNIYLLDDGRLVQWRVRQRTIAGVGNGDWQSVNSQGVALMFFQAPSGFTIQPSAQGILDVTPTWFGAGSKGAYYGITHATPIHKDNGIFCAGLGGKVVPELGIDGHCYFHVCGVVPRLNQGAYHPSFNPMGSASVLETTGRDWSRKWYAVDAVPLKNTADCFDFTGANRTSYPYLVGKVVGSTASSSTLSGSIAAGDKFCGRPDGKFYDAIYASGQGGVIDYRLSACDMGSKEEAAKVFQKVVNGSYRGKENLVWSFIGEGHSFVKTGTASWESVQNGRFRFAVQTGGDWLSGTGASTNGFMGTGDVRVYKTYLVGSNGNVWEVLGSTQRGKYGDIYRSGDVMYAGIGDSTQVTDFNNQFPNGTTITIVQTRYTPSLNSSVRISVSGDFTQVDLFAEPSVILNEASFRNGWLGGWAGMPSSAPAGDIDFTRKVKVGTPTRIYKLPSGAWSSGEMPNFNSILNGSTRGWSSDKTILYTFTYTAFAKQTKPSTNKPVLNGVEGLGCVYATARGHKDDAVLLAESFMGKVLTSTAAPYAQLKVFENTRFGSTGIINQYPIAGSHSPIGIIAPNNDSPAVKALWYQTADNQQCSLNFAWNELVWKNLIVKDVNTASSPVKQGEVYVIKADVPLKGQIFKANGNNAGWNWSGMYMGDEGEVYYGGGNSVSLDTTVKSYQGKSDGWGDDSTVRIIDGIGTFINLNGDTCLYGTHELAIPYGYTKNKARACSQVSGVDL
ncbi:hypothetical protein ABVY47_000534 [Vibrio parahaemolyticus]|nr:hypothetical protein [Vibrio parahaemolyticus]EGQ9423623.1 hypothetical protein [Vibrio parahaemolyticus]EGQ9687016.1 hypothetical protein [Vibrio parahaemolyticus]EGQ9926689.1 hypothetical protein [Vibrio parahaemolyticus]EHV2393858.1 hypothetical protein [Vibrio parahaemolyticus]